MCAEKVTKMNVTQQSNFLAFKSDIHNSTDNIIKANFVTQLRLTSSVKKTDGYFANADV